MSRSSSQHNNKISFTAADPKLLVQGEPEMQLPEDMELDEADADADTAADAAAEDAASADEPANEAGDDEQAPVAPDQPEAEPEGSADADEQDMDQDAAHEGQQQDAEGQPGADEPAEDTDLPAGRQGGLHSLEVRYLRLLSQAAASLCGQPVPA